MFKDREVVLVIGGVLGCEGTTDVEVRVPVVEEFVFVCPTWLHRKRIGN
jgi:hypothetical protein